MTTLPALRAPLPVLVDEVLNVTATLHPDEALQRLGPLWAASKPGIAQRALLAARIALMRKAMTVAPLVVALPEPEPEPLPAAQPATGLALEWLELFPKLPISGMTGSIAANCTLMAVDGDSWLLHLDPAHSALFNATQQRRLNDALNQHLQRTLTLSIELIKPEQETPAQAASRRRANRQREAEESIHGDPFIQQMMQQFGAVIRNDTIEPVEALVTQG